MEARTLGQLIEECREELDDEVGPHLWDDPILTRHLNEAVEEACVRARLLVESGRADICKIPLRVGQADYVLHSSVLVIRRAVLSDRTSVPLCRTTSTALDSHCRSWREEQGRPEYIVRDRQARALSVTPVPTEPLDLELTVWRMPASDEVMEGDDDEPVIDAMHHRKLVHWACFRAFSKKDSERHSPTDAQLHYSLFENYFGERPTARELQQLSIDPVTGTQAHWF